VGGFSAHAPCYRGGLTDTLPPRLFSLPSLCLSFPAGARLASLASLALAYPHPLSFLLPRSRSYSPGLVLTPPASFLLPRPRSCLPGLARACSCWPSLDCARSCWPSLVCTRSCLPASLALVLAGLSSSALVLLLRPCWRSLALTGPAGVHAC
jgi:hypothetical protein